MTKLALQAGAVFRAHFPFFENNPDTIYLDSAATSQKPHSMLQKINHFYAHQNCNVHRGKYGLASELTAEYEAVRVKALSFLNAADVGKLVWTKGATESINLFADTFQSQLQPGDEIIVSQLEHHANFLPWLELAKKKGIVVKIAKLDSDQSFHEDNLIRLISSKTKLIAFTMQSNVLGQVLPAKSICNRAKQFGIKTILDASQAVSHQDINVKDLGCDALVFSCHKFYSTTGLGCLYLSDELIERLPPYQFGGEMVKTADNQTAEYQSGVAKFEAGTPNIEAVLAFGSVLDFINQCDWLLLRQHEAELFNYLLKQLALLSPITIIGQGPKRGVVAFIYQGMHSSDIADLLGQMNIAVRTGSMCAQPLINSLGLEQGVIRVSILPYNTYAEIDALISGLKQVEDFL